MASEKPSAKPDVRKFAEVRFAEIEALYDLPAEVGCIAPASGDEPPATVFPEPALGGITQYVDLKGALVPKPAPLSNPTLFIDVRDSATVRRTFVRGRSVPIDGKWVYVFRGEEPVGGDARPFAELYVKGGRFRSGKSDLGNDPRDAKGGEEVLFLERARVVGPKRVPYRYFFYLAQHRLTGECLERLRSDLWSRGVSLDDPLHVDVHAVGAPAGAASSLTLLTKGEPVPDPEQCGYKVHLADALKEGMRRAFLFHDALEAYEAAEEKLAGSSEYVLAKRIQVLTQRTSLCELVFPELFNYLGDVERDSGRRFFAAHLALGDLLLWTGEEQRRGHWWVGGEKVQAYHDGPRGSGRASPRGEEPWGNAFSRAMTDAYESGASELFWTTVGAVHLRVKELATGRQWLLRNFERSLSTKEAIAHAGAPQVFQSGRKGQQAISWGLGAVIEAYADSWNRHYREKALENLQEWLSFRYGIAVIPRDPGERRHYRREMAQARRGRASALKIEAQAIKNVRFASGAFNTFSLGIEAVNTGFGVRDALDNSEDGWKWVDATGAILDGYEALTEVTKLAPKVEIKLVGRLAPLKAFTPLAAVAGVIDIAGGVRGAVTAEEGGARFGHGMITGGAAFALVAAVELSGGIFIGVVVAGILLQSLGQGLVSAFTPLQRLLRNGRFGNGGGYLDKGADFIDRQVDEDWYKGKQLSALKADIPGQLHALDEILFNFKPKLGMAGRRIHLVIELENPSQVTRVAKWTIGGDVIKDGAKKPLAVNDAALVGLPDKESGTSVGLTECDASVNLVVLDGSVTLDVRGDGTARITRNFKQAFRPNAPMEVYGP